MISSVHTYGWLGSLCSMLPDTVVADNDLHTRLAFAQVCICNAVIPCGHVINLLGTTTYSTTCIRVFERTLQVSVDAGFT